MATTSAVFFKVYISLMLFFYSVRILRIKGMYDILNVKVFDGHHGAHAHRGALHHVIHSLTAHSKMTKN